MHKEHISGNAKIREEHKFTLLNILRQASPISRTEIYKQTRISKPTITRIIDELLKQGVVREVGPGESQAGRKPALLELNPTAYYCLGLNISRNTIRAALVNFAMQVVHRELVSIKGISNIEAFCQQVETTIRKIYEKCAFALEKLLGIGIGVPGSVDFAKGIVVDFALAHRLMHIPLGEQLAQTFGTKVYVDNNANTRALGEYWYGYGKGLQDLVFVIASEGIGSGIISNGEILRGKNNITGELGHMTVNIDGRQCRCGRFGCVEAYCSTEAIENGVREALRRGRKSMLTQFETIDYKQIGQCADLGDRLCLEQLEEAACVLSTGLANLIGILNPELVVLSGDLFDAGTTFYNLVCEMTQKRLVSPLAQEVIFKKRKVSDSLYEIGAASLVYKAFFQD